MEIKKIISDAENAVKKGISTSSLNGGSGSSTLTTRQDLEPTITNLAYRGTPLRDKMRRETGIGAAFTYNTVEALFGGAESPNPRDAVYADGALPDYKTTTYGTKIVSYVPIGYSGSVTGLAQAAGDAVIDLYSAEVEKGTRRVIQAEEWLNFWGSTTTLNSRSQAQFPGLDQLITTNVVDAGGAVVSKSLIDQACELIVNHGGQATDLFCSNRVGININNLFNQYAQVIINGNDRDALTLGNKVRDISTVAGPLGISPDFFLNPGNQYPLSNGTSSFPHGATTSTIFIVNMAFLSMRDLKALGMEELGRVADKRDFFVNEYTALKLLAEPWCAKITNVSDTIISA